MSEKRFIIFLQELLTMINIEDKSSIALGKNAVIAVKGLAFSSAKADGITMRVMDRAETEFDYLVMHAEEFSGVPGDYHENEKRRLRLRQMLRPSC